MQEQGQDAPRATPLRRAIAGFLVFGMLLSGALLMLLGGRAFRPFVIFFDHPIRTIFGVQESSLFYIGLLAFVAAIAILCVMQKISPVRPRPDCAAIQREVENMRGPMQARQRARLGILAVMAPALILMLPFTWILRQIQPITPMLAGMGDADLQRIAIVAGVLIALAGYGMVRLLRRGDSGGS